MHSIRWNNTIVVSIVKIIVRLVVLFIIISWFLDLRLDELTNRVEDAGKLARNTFQEVMDIDREVEIIRNNIDAVGGGASPSSIGVMNERELLILVEK